MSRASLREARVGLIVVAGLAGLLGLLGLAAGGPAYLSARRTIDVVFRDGQGLRVGSAVRVAGIDAGRVEAIDLAEVDGALRAKVRLALPADLVARLKQDVKVTIQASLTGPGCVNIVSSGRSAVALIPGQVVQGVETSFFDPILEQVGLGPVERSHLSHTIAEVRQTVDSAGPRLRQALAALQAAAAGLRETAEAVRPSVEATVAHVEDLARRLDAAAPKVEATLAHLEGLTTGAEALVAENRPNLQATLASVRDVTATLQDMLAKDREGLGRLVKGAESTRQRADRVLYNMEVLSGQGVQILKGSRTQVERTVANVHDMTDWGTKLVQKLHANPFYLSPFYKPTPEDKRAMGLYDTAQQFASAAEELHDTVKKLQAMRSAPMTPQEQQAYGALYQGAAGLTQKLQAISQQLAEGLRPAPRR